MRWVVVALLVLSGCSEAPEEDAKDAAPELGTMAPTVHNVTLADEVLAGSQSFEGTFLPHENLLLENVAGVEGSAHVHLLDLPAGRPVFVTVTLDHEADPGYIQGSVQQSDGAAYSWHCACDAVPAVYETHLMLAPGTDARLLVRQALPSSAQASYTADVIWTAPTMEIYAGLPLEVHVEAGDNITLESSDGALLNGVMVYGPDTNPVTRLEGPAVRYEPEVPGAHTFLQLGHGAPARMMVEGEAPSWRILGLMVEATGRNDVPASTAGQEMQWQHETTAAPVRVQACSSSELFLREPRIRIDFPGGGSVENENFQQSNVGVGGLCIWTTLGDDRLYAGTYTTTYSNQGSGETWVETTFTYLAR